MESAGMELIRILLGEGQHEVSTTKLEELSQTTTNKQTRNFNQQTEELGSTHATGECVCAVVASEQRCVCVNVYVFVLSGFIEMQDS